VQSYQEVDAVSQIVPTGTANPPSRSTCGYQEVATGDAAEAVAFLHTITVPSPAGTGTSTATINYTSVSDFVSSLVDAHGNSRNYSVVDGTHTQVTLKDSHANTVFAWTVGFDSHMHPGSVTDGAGNSLGTAAYSDPNDTDRPSSITEGNGKTTSFTWDQYGHLVTATSPRMVSVTNTWNYSVFSLGRLTSVKEGAKTATSFSYLEPSGLIQVINTPTPGTAGTGSTVQTSFTYSSLGNVLTVVSPGNTAAATITETFNYTNDPSDPAHGIAAYSQAEVLGQPLTVTDNLGKVSHFRYSPRGVMIAAIDALGYQRTVSTNIADQPVLTTDPQTGQTGAGCGTTIYRYLYPGGPANMVQQFDESGNTVRQVAATLGLEGEALARTGSGEAETVAFDAAHRVVSLTDGDNHQTTINYNPAGYPSVIHYPGGDTVQFPSYDGAGRPLTRIDGQGVTTNYQYNDTSGRLSAILYPATTALNVSLTYETYGRLSSITNGTGGNGYSYDDLNNVTEVTTNYTGVPGKTVRYGFYHDGSRQSMTTPAGSYSYSDDADGRLVSLTNSLNEVSSWSYLDNGWPSTQQLTTPGSPPPVVATTTYTHNPVGFITDLTTRNSANAILSEFGSMTADADGNRKSVTATLPGTSGFGGATSYALDGKLQLTQESSARSGGYTNNFGYDGAGNPTTLRGVTQSYNANNQNAAVAYDGNGNPTTNQGAALTYKPESRLASWGSAMTAGYLPDGLRGWKHNSSGYTYFVYDGTVPVAEMDSSGNVTAVNTFGANGLLSRHANTLTTFYTFDPQGSVAQRLNSSGTVLSSHMFDAYGLELSSPATSEPFGFGAQFGEQTDRETGLVLMTHRYYWVTCHAHGLSLRTGKGHARDK
jgi:YD repeat-containing protein